MQSYFAVCLKRSGLHFTVTQRVVLSFPRNPSDSLPSEWRVCSMVVGKTKDTWLVRVLSISSVKTKEKELIII